MGECVAFDGNAAALGLDDPQLRDRRGLNVTVKPNRTKCY
jgi:hypothetical protein